MRDEATAALQKVSGSFDKLKESIEKSQEAANRAGEGLKNLLETFIGGVGLYEVINKTIEATAKWEEQMSMVARTTGLAGEQLQRFGDDAVSMSQHLAQSSNDLLTVGEIL